MVIRYRAGFQLPLELPRLVLVSCFVQPHDGEERAVAEQQGSQPDAAQTGQVAVELVGIDEAQPEYVNIVQVNHDPFVFQMAFGRYLVPMLTRPGDSEALRERVERAGIPVEVVARLLVSPSVLVEMVNVLQDQLDAYQRQFGAIPKYWQGGGEDSSDGN